MLENNEHKKNCIICDTNKWVIIYSKEHHLHGQRNNNLFFDQKLVLCEECGCIRVLFNESYKDENLINYYRSVSRTPIVLKKVICDRKDPRVVNALNRVKFIQANTKGEKLLEIGFGDGVTLMEAHRQNFNCSGVDVTGDYNHNLAYMEEEGVKIHNMDFFDFDSVEKYDVIASFLLLEHIKCPLSFISQVNGLLVEDGFFVLEVPDVKNYKNFYSETQLTFEHIFHYTIETLEKIMNLGGFELVNFLSPGASYPFAMTACFRKSRLPISKFSLGGNGKKVLHYFQNYLSRMESYRATLLTYFNLIIEHHSKIVVFGAGNFFETIINIVGRDKVRFIDFFVDETVSKIGSSFYGKEIKGIDSLHECKPKCILIASEMFAEQIKEKIEGFLPDSSVYCFQDEVISKIDDDENGGKKVLC